MENDNKIKHIQVETLAKDMADAISDNKGGLIKQIIHEQEMHEAQKINLSPESKRNQIFMLVSFVLIVLSLTAISYFALSQQTVFTGEVQTRATSEIFLDQTEFKEISGLTKEQIVQTLKNELSTTKIKTGGVEGLYLTENKKIVGFKRFISLLEGNFPTTSFNLVDDNFLIGISNQETKNLFMLLGVRSFSDIFDSMHVWENKLFFDFHGFFGVDISSDTKYLLTKNFENGTVLNKNSRILYDKNNKIVIMYVFTDDKSVVITNSENAAKETILRLSSSRVKK